MAKVLTKEQLQDEANKVFAEYPNAKQVFATVDGNVFLVKNHAELHAGKEGTVVTFDRPIKNEDDNEGKDEKPAKAEDQIKAINDAKTLEELEPFKSDIRVTVKKALELKTTELTQAQ